MRVETSVYYCTLAWTLEVVSHRNIIYIHTSIHIYTYITIVIKHNIGEIALTFEAICDHIWYQINLRVNFVTWISSQHLCYSVFRGNIIIHAENKRMSNRKWFAVFTESFQMFDIIHVSKILQNNVISSLQLCQLAGTRGQVHVRNGLVIGSVGLSSSSWYGVTYKAILSIDRNLDWMKSYLKTVHNCDVSSCRLHISIHISRHRNCNG